jgi:hypothetical protein
MRVIYIVILLTISFNISLAQNQTILALRDSITKSDRFWDDESLVRGIQDSVLNLFRKNLTDTNSVVLLRYYLHALRQYNPITDTSIEQGEALISLQINSGVKKGPYFYNGLAACYITLGRMAQINNKFSKSKELFEKSISVCNTGLSKTTNRNRIYLLLLSKKSIVYNNIGGIIYQSTNHKDPIGKRKQVGPLIEKYFLLADSIDEMVINHPLSKLEPDPCMGNSNEVLQNLILLYGYYYQNDQKANFYHLKLLERAKQCGGDKILNTLDVTWGWIKFSKEEFRDCIPYFLRFLKNNPNVKSPQVQDTRFALVESYYNLKKLDSVIYYGNAYFQDTLFAKDYLFLSMSSMYMTEMYLELGNKVKARELLGLSKEFMAKSQHEAILREYRKEGEEIIIQGALAKLSELSNTLEERERNLTILKIVILISLLLASLVAAFYFFRRLLVLKAPKN